MKSILRLNRRRLLRGASVSGAGLATASVLGCSKGRGPATTSGTNVSPQAGTQPRRGGVLNYPGGFAGSFDTRSAPFDPNKQVAFSARGFTLFYQRLLGYNLETYAAEPEIAQKWEQASQTEYVFHLQPNVTWHDKPPVNGRPLTSDDVVYNLERARSNDPSFVSRSLLTLVDKIEAPDKATVRVTTKEPDAGTLTKLSADNLGMLAKEAVEQNPKLITAESVIGTGPFMMKSVEQKVGADYVRNPNYWKPGLPYLDGLRTKHFADLLVAWSAFLANQEDLALIPGPEVKKYISQQGVGYTPAWYADDTFGALQSPNTKLKPLDDQRVTRALRLLTDHDEMVKAWSEVQFGKGGYGSIFPAALSAWDLTDDEYRQHLEWKQPKDDAAKEAVSLLTAAGMSKDHPLQFTITAVTTPQNEVASELLQAQWKRLSGGIVDTQIKPADSPTLDNQRANKTFAYLCAGTSVGMVEPDIWLTSMYRSGGSQNYTSYSDPTLDAMIDKQRGTFDVAQRKALVKQIVLYMIDHHPGTLSANRFFLYGVNPKVQNRKAEYFLNGRQYQSVWLSA